MNLSFEKVYCNKGYVIIVGWALASGREVGQGFSDQHLICIISYGW